MAAPAVLCACHSRAMYIHAYIYTWFVLFCVDVTVERYTYCARTHTYLFIAYIHTYTHTNTFVQYCVDVTVERCRYCGAGGGESLVSIARDWGTSFLQVCRVGLHQCACMHVRAYQLLLHTFPPAEYLRVSCDALTSLLCVCASESAASAMAVCVCVCVCAYLMEYAGLNFVVSQGILVRQQQKS
jgi:hypothetical protein